VRRAALGTLLLALAVAGAGCPCVNSVVNASPELRWWLFSNFGASRICPEMLKRGVPLKLPQLGAASIGRFFPEQCTVQMDDPSQTIVMMTAGTGYASLPFVRRVGFSVSMGVVYRPDFRMESEGTWVWGRFDHFVTPPDLRVMGVENPVVNLATQTPAGNVASMIGNSLVAGEIGKGFTVVHQDDGDDFAVGHLEPPDKPKRQFKPGADHAVLGSDVTQISAASRDYLGPFEIPSGAVLFFHAQLAAAPIVYAVVDRNVGDAWRRSYASAQGLAPPPGPVPFQGVLQPGEVTLKLAVLPGQYYFVVENQAQPPVAPLGMPLPFPETLAYVTYSAEAGDK
jgi:hypothetical protein